MVPFGHEYLNIFSFILSLLFVNFKLNSTELIKYDVSQFGKYDLKPLSLKHKINDFG